MNTNSTKSSTLGSTTTNSNIEPSGKATHQNTIKSGTPRKTSTMQNTQSNDSTGATQESPEWIHVTINRLSSAPPPVVKQEQRSHRPASDAEHIARNASPTSPNYSGSPRREVAHASINWTDCTDDGCQIHLGEKVRVRLVPTIHQEIEKTKCCPRPRLATGDGSKPRRGLGTPTTSSTKGPKGPSRNHELGALFQ